MLPLIGFELTPWSLKRPTRGDDDAVDILGIALGYGRQRFAAIPQKSPCACRR